MKACYMLGLLAAAALSGCGEEEVSDVAAGDDVAGRVVTAELERRNAKLQSENARLRRELDKATESSDLAAELSRELITYTAQEERDGKLMDGAHRLHAVVLEARVTMAKVNGIVEMATAMLRERNTLDGALAGGKDAVWFAGRRGALGAEMKEAAVRLRQLVAEMRKQQLSEETCEKGLRLAGDLEKPAKGE